MSEEKFEQRTELSVQEQFVLKEYDAAVKLTFHVDDLRDRLVKFFLSFSAVAVAALMVLLKGEAEAGEFAIPEAIVGVLLVVVTGLGAVVVRIIGRLRGSQIEHFRIINNIRVYFLRENLELWNTVELSQETLPEPNRRSGSYSWVFAIVLVSGFFGGLAAYLILYKVLSLLSFGWAVASSIASVAVLIVCLDLSYFAAAKPRVRRVYGARPVPRPN